MIVLDENIDEPQRRRLEMWRIRVRQIGVEVGRLGMKDLNDWLVLFPRITSAKVLKWSSSPSPSNLAGC